MAKILLINKASFLSFVSNNSFVLIHVAFIQHVEHFILHFLTAVYIYATEIVKKGIKDTDVILALENECKKTDGCWFSKAWKECRQAPQSGTHQAELVQEEGDLPPSRELWHSVSPVVCPKEGTAKTYPA